MKIRITDKKIIAILWIVLAFAFPLFAVGFLRFNKEIFKIHIAIPMFIVGIIIGTSCLVLLMRKKIVKKTIFKNKFWGLLILLIFAFFLWHIIELTRAIDQMQAMREMMKLALGIITLLFIILFFPSGENFIKKFWIIVIWSSSVFLLFLIYQYAFVFKASFLGSHLQQATGANRNQLAWYLTLVFPFALSYFWHSKKKLITFIPLFIITISLLYISSRGAWIVAATSVPIFIFITSKGKKRIKNMIILLLLMGIIILIGYLILLASVGKTEIFERFLSLFQSTNEIPKYHSYQTRLSLLKTGSYSFLNNPIIGIGLTNSQHFLGMVTHNDYLGIFLELGLIGGGIFMGILIIISKIIKWRYVPYYNLKKSSWVSMGNRVAFIALCISLLFINTYTTLLFWILFGLILVTTKNEKHDLGMTKTLKNLQTHF